MERASRLFRILFVFLFLASTIPVYQPALAADGGDDTPVPRQASITVPYTRYEWWLLRWSDNQVACQVFIDHENWPTPEEVLQDCGGSIYRQWLNTPLCNGLGEGGLVPSQCSGLYLHFLGSEPAEKSILVDLPEAQVWVELSGCDPIQPENFCTEIPSLLFTGEEPLPNEQITAIHAVRDGYPYQCEGSTCEIPLISTGMSGATIEFWADSSFGDSSKHFSALVRVIDSGVSSSPTGGGWYVDVLSTQKRGGPTASCAQTWQAFPPVGGPPGWLLTPESPDLLTTNVAYSYLAGRLIAQGLVDASSCPGGGLLSNGYADACGLELAQPLVEEWQNRFDSQIISVAQETGVPAQLMKNVFAQESQFWPGVFRVANEFGLGQITDNGAETVLLWNPAFYTQFCPLVLDEEVCRPGYIYLDAADAAILRGALALEARSDCADCEAGIDLTDTEFSISLFAHTILANCEQVGQIVFNATGRMAGSVSNYADIWRYTLANYHSGPGCLSYAMYTAWAARSVMDWEHVSGYLTEPCESAITYVESVTSSP